MTKRINCQLSAEVNRYQSLGPILNLKKMAYSIIQTLLPQIKLHLLIREHICNQEMGLNEFSRRSHMEENELR